MLFSNTRVNVYVVLVDYLLGDRTFCTELYSEMIQFADEAKILVQFISNDQITQQTFCNSSHGIFILPLAPHTNPYLISQLESMTKFPCHSLLKIYLDKESQHKCLSGASLCLMPWNTTSLLNNKQWWIVVKQCLLQHCVMYLREWFYNNDLQKSQSR
jgi:hypothetical protein